MQMQGRALFEQLPQDDNLRRSLRIPSVEFYHGAKVLSSTHENSFTVTVVEQMKSHL